jgi:hypothetical protein
MVSPLEQVGGEWSACAADLDAGLEGDARHLPIGRLS